MSQRNSNGSIEYLDVWRQLFDKRMFALAKSCQSTRERFQSGFQGSSIFGRDFDARRWNLPNIFGDIVAWAIGLNWLVNEQGGDG